MVENHEGNHSIVIDDTSPKQTLYIYKCDGCTILVSSIFSKWLLRRPRPVPFVIYLCNTTGA